MKPELIRLYKICRVCGVTPRRALDQAKSWMLAYADTSMIQLTTD